MWKPTISRYSWKLICKTQHFFRIWKIPVIIFQFRALQNYGTRNARTGEQNSLKPYCTHKFYPCWCVWYSSFITWWHLFVILRKILRLRSWIVFACYNEDFVKSRFSSIHFTVFWPGWRKSFVIPRISLNKGSLNRDSTVDTIIRIEKQITNQARRVDNIKFWEPL